MTRLPPLVWTPEMIARVHKRRAQGLTNSAIAQELGVSRAAVGSMLHREREAQASRMQSSTPSTAIEGLAATLDATPARAARIWDRWAVSARPDYQTAHERAGR